MEGKISECCKEWSWGQEDRIGHRCNLRGSR